eukprot:Sspe_Gene.29067::Locus_13569_Transcript_4_8_Confidence_0.455_Length_479::g.29067::m.29067
MQPFEAGWNNGPKHCEWCTCLGGKLRCMKLCWSEGEPCTLRSGDVCKSDEVDRENDCPTASGLHCVPDRDTPGVKKCGRLCGGVACPTYHVCQDDKCHAPCT